MKNTDENLPLFWQFHQNNYNNNKRICYLFLHCANKLNKLMSGTKTERIHLQAKFSFKLLLHLIEMKKKGRINEKKQNRKKNIQVGTAE